MEKNRPAQHKQSSRKGKKAWIKNIDLDDLTEGLEQNRENLIKFGVETLDDLQSQKLFVVDTKGDEELKPKTIKVLKSTEILNKRSKVPGLENAHKKKDRVSKKDVKRLMQIAGRDKLAHSSSKAKIDKDGLITTKAYDVWDEPEDFKEANKPEILKKLSSSEWTKAKKKPTTLGRAPIQVKKTETIPNAGKSYNPSLESWKNLINQEYITEQAREDARLEIQAERAKIQKLIETMDDTEEVDSDNDADGDEQEDDNDAEKTEDAFSLSLNKPVVNKKKTKTQRNKQAKHQERVELENSLRELKQQLKQLKKIPLYQEEVESKEHKTRTTEIEKVQKRQKLGSRHKIQEDTLDVKLSDELTDSLRSLKPEGNLLIETMHGMQSKGVIESRIPYRRRRRRYAPKITEKWTYKDFK